MSNRITIPLQNGFSLVAERNSDPNYSREIFIGIIDKSGVWCQDLAIVRNSYTYDSNWDVNWKDGEFDVLVYSDENNEDFTHDFTIGMRNGGEQNE